MRISVLPDPKTYECADECHHQAGRCGEWIEALMAIGCSRCGERFRAWEHYLSSPTLAHFACVIEALRAA